MIDPLLIAECGGLLAVPLLIAVMGVYRVGMAESGVVTRFGRFHRVVGSGAHWKVPIDHLAAMITCEQAR